MRKTTLLRLSLLLSLIACFSAGALSQVVRCGTMENDSLLRLQFPENETKEQFENWIHEAIEEAKSNKIIGGVYQIPVVFHVIHQGEAIGSGTNISQAAIQSQIDVFNEDFRRIIGTNGYNTHPDGADTEIEFCLAQRRPDGSAFAAGQPGVNRVLYSTITGTPPPYGQGIINSTIKTWTYNGGVATATRGWSPDKYLNIWIAPLSGGLLGYAQFPTTPLGGFSSCQSGGSAATDGVVFTYNSIGKSSVTGFGGPYNEGRTATHEVGHWLGLRHIWGDGPGDCSTEDYCNDTPLAASPNGGCPGGMNSCTNAPDQGPDMIENYMDYTNDLCMNIFTKDQKMRMRAVLEGSPRRVNLINSDACIPPNASDASVTDVFTPKGDHCPGAITPSVQLRNRGSSNLTSATINYKIDNGAVTTFAWTGTLAPGASLTVALPAFTATLGTHLFKSYTTLPNGAADPSTIYDTSSIAFVVSNGIMPNYTQDFENPSFPPDIKWTIDNPNSDCFEWTGASGVSSTGIFTNNVAHLPFFGNGNTGTGATNYENLVTPVFILPCNATNAKLDFKVAHRRRNTSTADVLVVEISTDCGGTWTSIFNQSGAALAQNGATTGNTEYYPTVAADWKSFSVNLQTYVQATSRNVRFRFRGRSGNGNNVFLDDILFSATVPGEATVLQGATEILDGGYSNVGGILVGGSQTTTYTVQNTGTTSLTLTAPITVTGTGYALGTSFGSTTLAAGASTTFTVTFSPAAAGASTGNVSFGTSDCDEGTYNFTLNGTGLVTPPAADFSVGSTSVCAGSSVTFTNLSTNATSYNWTFAGGTPATSTAVNPAVTYPAAGTYTVTLTATNAFGSDTETKTNYIVVVTAVTASALPLTEGFSAATFPPTGWTLVNAGGNTWERSATVGIAPTVGNSMVFRNFDINETADDEMRIKPLTFSGLLSAQLTFDVAYRRYNAANSDGLEVLVSTDCGGSYTSVYSKTGSVLASVTGNQTTVFVPTAAQWRNETVDLSPFIGQPNVIVVFRNLSDYGNNLYVDNINITGVAGVIAPVASFTGTPTSLCAGQTVTYTNTSANSPTSYSWTFAGGTPAISTAANPTVTYSAAGTYDVSLTATNSGGSHTSTQPGYVTVSANVTPAFTAVGPYCSGATIPAFATTSTNGITGTWSPAINNTATTTYTFTPTAGQCATATTRTVTITPNATPAFAAVGPYCSGATIPAFATTSTNGITGTWSPAINNTATTTYTFTPTAGQCATATMRTVTITPNATPAFAAAGPYCSGATIPAFATTSTNGITGSWSPAINNTATTTYTFTPTAGQCATSATMTVTITPNVIPAFAAAGPYCSGATIPAFATNSTNGITGSWSPAINNTATTTYTFTPTAGQCATSATMTVTITPNVIPAFAAAGPYCSGATIPSLPITSTNGITGSWSPAINNTATTTYTFTPTAGQCATSATMTVTITPNVIPAFAAAGPYCSGATIPSLPITSTNGITGSWSPAINNTATTTYTFTPTAGQCATNATMTVTITPNVTPVFAPVPNQCVSSTPPVLATISDNGITGTWSPSAITTSEAGSFDFIFTPDNGQCAQPVTITVTVGAQTIPAFTQVPGFCEGSTAPVLPLTSNDGFTGTWSPSVVSNVTGGAYVFTPGAGQCASAVTMTIIVDAPVTPAFATEGPICAGATAPALEPVSQNGIPGSWSPTVISNTASGTYTFTPSPGQCATSQTLSVLVNPVPEVILLPINDLCIYNSAVTLTQGSPAGGIYDGNGVSGGQFDPAVAGLGSSLITYSFTNTSGCSATAINSINVEQCLGVEENSEAVINLYPNPSEGSFVVEAKGEQIESISVYDQAGKLILLRKTSGESVIVDLREQATGVYSVRVTTGTTTKTIPVIIQK